MLWLQQQQEEVGSHSNYSRHWHRTADMLLAAGYSSYCSNCYKLRNHSRLLLGQLVLLLKRVRLAGCNYCNGYCTVKDVTEAKKS